MASSFRWTSDALFENTEKLPQRLDRALAAAVRFSATKTEAYMKANAPWTDQTTNARNGLRTYPFHEGRTHGFHLAHGVPYGIWLEVRWNGRYGIIPESTREGGMMVMSLVTKLLAGLDGK
jgi:hypothetical protein